MAEVMKKKRWIGLYVENEIGVLAKIAGLFSGKSYNLDSLTVGEAEMPDISRMTISLTSDDQTFEQVKKQLNRCVEVIKVVDFTDVPLHMKELMYVKVSSCSAADKEEVFRAAQTFACKVADYGKDSVLLECVQTYHHNDELLKLLKELFANRIELVRGGSVAIESIHISDR